MVVLAMLAQGVVIVLQMLVLLGTLQGVVWIKVAVDCATLQVKFKWHQGSRFKQQEPGDDRAWIMYPLHLHLSPTLLPPNISIGGLRPLQGRHLDCVHRHRLVSSSKRGGLRPIQGLHPIQDLHLGAHH